jgi:lambda repressor-like predicted transcriptional regulator
MSTTSSAVADLQSQWHTLHDLDRASAVFAIHRTGTSLRELAKALNCSESLLRHLLAALQAPPADRFLARKNKTSTNELARRSKAAGIRRFSMHREAREFERAQASLQGCRNICDWLVKEGIPGSYGEQIVAEARRQIALTELGGKFPKYPAPPDMPTEQIIQRCKPSEAAIHELTSVAWFGTWLAFRAYYAFTDSWVRDNAMDLALDKQTKR